MTLFHHRIRIRVMILSGAAIYCGFRIFYFHEEFYFHGLELSVAPLIERVLAFGE